MHQLEKARTIRAQCMEFGYTVEHRQHPNVRRQANSKKAFVRRGHSVINDFGCRCPLHRVWTFEAWGGYATCRFKSTPFFNSTPYPHKGSMANAKLIAKYPSAFAISFDEMPEGPPRSAPSDTSYSKYGPKSAGKSMTISDILSTICTKKSNNNFIDVFLSSPSQGSSTRRSNVKALLDTGSVAGDFVSLCVLKDQKLDTCIQTNGSKLVWSGLDNTCYDVSSTIPLQVSYFSENLNKYALIDLQATVLNSSPIDLVIGRDTIKSIIFFLRYLVNWRLTRPVREPSRDQIQLL